ncbi:hypothetical protein FSP39_012470 [Pinctada imbricata]|uniref:Uncharacterized protein n=1 Tax=Pinctada imbricata TaxID=66713 RepID=A0AA88YL04_PINIB|nr:hypothetical protein FSP39_012470 [Pinctada imbricata]
MKSMSKIQAAIKQAVTPTVKFVCLKVRVLYTGNYDQARNKLALAEIQSDLQTEAEEDKLEDTRRQKRYLRFLSTENLREKHDAKIHVYEILKNWLYLLDNQ